MGCASSASTDLGDERPEGAAPRSSRGYPGVSSNPVEAACTQKIETRANSELYAKLRFSTPFIQAEWDHVAACIGVASPEGRLRHQKGDDSGAACHNARGVLAHESRQRPHNMEQS